MYVITDKIGVAFCVTPTLEHQENGNPLVKNGSYAIASILVGNEYENVANVPDDYADCKYCFDGKNWTPNPDYVAPADYNDAITALETLGYTEG